MNKSKIEWCNMTWNPVTGCLHECSYCYAEKIANRFSLTNYHKLAGIEPRNEVLKEPYTDWDKSGICRNNPYPFGFDPTFHKYRLDEPAKIQKPQKIFVCSMADLFGEWVPDQWIMQILTACRQAPQHTYMFLTKNPKRYAKFADYIRPNWCIGTTITGVGDKEKIKDLIEPYTLGEKFLSIEPLQNDIGEMQLSRGIMHKWIDWVIIGQQTGSGAKPPKDEWVQSISDQCKAVGIPVFVKYPLYEKFPIKEWPEGLK